MMKDTQRMQLRPADLLGRSGKPTEFEQYNRDLLNIVAATIAEVQDCGGVDARCTVDVVCEENPDLEIVWGWDTIATLADSLLYAEILPLSRIYTERFAEYNVRYFLDCLPPYRVRVVSDIHFVADEPIFRFHVSSGLIRFSEQCIYLRYSHVLSLAETLLHEMAHAATGGEHDEAWMDQMRRLKAHGAPVADCELADEPQEVRS